MKPVIINVHLDKKCKRCGKGGATDNGVCLACIAKAVKQGEFDHILKKVRKEAGLELNKRKGDA